MLHSDDRRLSKYLGSDKRKFLIIITKAERLSLVQWLLQVNDEDLLSQVIKIKEDSDNVNNQQENLLTEHMKRYESGEMQFSSWEMLRYALKTQR